MEEYSTWGKGIEFTLLDLISFRSGSYTDMRGHIAGNSSGIGLNFRFKDLVHLQYNWSQSPGGGLQKYQTKDDFMVNLNLLNLLGIEE